MFAKVYGYLTGASAEADDGSSSSSSSDDEETTRASTSQIEDDSLGDLHRIEATRIVNFTWAELMKKQSEVGARIYEEVLLKEVGMSRLFLTTKIDTQAESFMVMLDAVVGYLEDPSTFDQKLRELGEEHMSRMNVKKRHFKHFRQGFMQAIREYIPWSERREAAWLWFWNRVIAGMTSDTSAAPYAKDLSPAEYTRRAAMIHRTFDTMMDGDPGDFGVTFYKTLLRTNPDIAVLFDAERIQTQAARFISMVHHTVNLLDDHRTFEFKMVELGRTHDTYGVELSMLSKFGATLTAALKAEEAVAAEWTEEMDSVWDWFWNIVAQLFTRGIMERRKETEEKKEYKPRSELPEIDSSAPMSSAATDALEPARMSRSTRTEM